MRPCPMTYYSSKKVWGEAFHHWGYRRESWTPFVSYLFQFAPRTRRTHLLGRLGYQLWLIVRQLPIKAGWWDAPIALRDFSRSNKHNCSWREAVKIEPIVSPKTGCWTVVCTRLLTLKFPLAAMFINICNVLMLLERFSREKVAAVQLTCASEINI